MMISKKLMWVLFAFLTLSLTGCGNQPTPHAAPQVVPPFVPTPASLLIDCPVPVIPASVDVSKLVDILTDALGSLEGCNYRMGLLRKAEHDRELQYQNLLKSASK